MKQPMLMSSSNSVSSSDSSEPKEIKNSLLLSRLPASPLLHQRQTPLMPPRPIASTSLDHLWSKQEKLETLELRLFALEDSERRFEHRLQLLEQPEEKDDDYMQLYITLLDQYNALKADYKQKEEGYQQQIDQLTLELERSKKKEEEEEEAYYREEDGYLMFDSTSISGEITHYRVKIPDIPSPHFHFQSSHLHMTLSKGLNPNAPEWKRK
ncbi:hypothetical protein EDC96DRAFT_521045 [Choanephora cucurbitarum]|nr:hypothetical protein EDC96DRAFT_521045 [Choanephora cucurbitarum]